MTKIAKTTKPTKGLPPITNDPNVSTTLPASASARIERVVETFKPNRNSVMTNNNEGNTEN